MNAILDNVSIVPSHTKYSWDSPAPRERSEAIEICPDWVDQLRDFIGGDFAEVASASHQPLAMFQSADTSTDSIISAPFPGCFPTELIVKIIHLGGESPPQTTFPIDFACPRIEPLVERALLRACCLVNKSWRPIASRELFRKAYIYDEGLVSDFLAVVKASGFESAVEQVEVRGTFERTEWLEKLLESCTGVTNVIIDSFSPVPNPMIRPSLSCWMAKATASSKRQ
ncbi:hypothetical protein P7C70_g3445, partial [Phenoliferia sp. Uapishka_3]